MYQILQKNIKTRLKKLGIKNNELERRSGLSEGAVSSILRGISKNPSLKSIFSIAKVLNCSIDDLVAHETDTASKAIDMTLHQWLEDLATKWSPNLHDEVYRFVNRYIEHHKIEATAWQALTCVLEIYTYSSSETSCHVNTKFAHWVLDKTFNNKNTARFFIKGSEDS